MMQAGSNVAERLKRLHVRRLQRLWTTLSLNLTRNSGYYALVSSVMCLCLVALKSDSHVHDDIDSELHYNFHAWDPQTAQKELPVLHRERRQVEGEVEPRIILFWTKYHGTATYDFGLGARPFESAGCRFANCKTTTDRLLLNESHAVIFHHSDVNASDLPTTRLEHQRWIYYTFTSPTNTAPLPRLLKDQFNWTMTYRRDSDIIHRYPYGALVSRKTLRKTYGKSKPNLNAARRSIGRKKKLVAWITSTCPTAVRRENYVRELAKFIQVDIYGGCGHLYCGSTDQCLKMLRADYKFVLAFENSLCGDYVTDKLYTALENGVVPVVYGGADYLAYAPAGSFVDARDFATPRHLADYLHLLNRNDNLYAKYLSWNEDYQVDRFPSDGWCQLCQLLHASPVEHQTYSDINKWWQDEVQCSSAYAGVVNASAGAVAANAVVEAGAGPPIKNSRTKP